MGYTHYWTFNGSTKLDDEINYYNAIQDINRFVRWYDKKHHIASGYTAKSKKTYDGVKINGIGNLRHEDFVLRDQLINSDNFNFCKTARKPYDILIVGSLLILKHHLKNNITISSDGGYNDWLEGCLAVNQCLRKIINIPATIANKQNIMEVI